MYKNAEIDGQIGEQAFERKPVHQIEKECGVNYGFPSKEEANKEVERRKVETLLLKYGGRRWFKNHKPNWFIALENEVEDSPRTYNATSISKQGAIYFDSQEAVEKAIKEIGTDRIKEALFEVR